MYDFWPDDIKPDDMDAPVKILKENAASLYDLTNGVLRAHIKTRYMRDEMRHSLEIVSSRMDDYSYELLKVSHELDMYPLTIIHWNSEGDTVEVEAEDEKEFVQALKTILSSKETNEILGKLLAQSDF